jgi:aminoglycoside phosphotransferase (APT) family kinase protein
MTDWDCHVDLDEHVVRELLREQFPALADASVAYLKEGWDSRAYEIAGTWIFRFPKRADVASQQAREQALLRAIDGRLPVAVPRYELHGRASARFPFAFAGYAKLAGRQARVGPDDVAPSIVDDLAAFLTALHAIPIEVPARVGVAHHGWRAPAQMRERALEALAGAASSLGPARHDACRAYLDRACEETAATTPAPTELCLLHNDLSSDHVLIDDHEHHVIGIIDWTDVEVGDPAVDLSGIYHFLGERGTRAVLARYGRSWDEALVRRARYFATCIALFQLFYGHATGRADEVGEGRRALALAGL